MKHANGLSPTGDSTLCTHATTAVWDRPPAAQRSAAAADSTPLTLLTSHGDAIMLRTTWALLVGATGSALELELELALVLGLALDRANGEGDEESFRPVERGGRDMATKSGEGEGERGVAEAGRKCGEHHDDGRMKRSSAAQCSRSG